MAAIASAGGPLVLADSALAAVLPVRLARRTFRPRVGRTLRFSGGRQRYTAVLSSIGNLPNSRPGDEHRFNLTFTVRGAGPPQGTYRFEMAGLPPFQLFVVPVGGGRKRYEAIVFSR